MHRARRQEQSLSDLPFVAGLLLLGFGYASIAYGTGAQEYLTRHSNILLILGGLLIAAVGAGSATKATYRHGETEREERESIAGNRTETDDL